MEREPLAVYTTVYPAAAPFLAEWYASVRAQTDTNFDLWIGVDSMTREQVVQAMGSLLQAQLRHGAPGDSPARIRRIAASEIAAQYPAVIFVDSDDVLEPERVAAARRSLAVADVTGCALRVVDRHGLDVGFTFGPGTATVDCEFLARWNVFGLSNTAFRSEVLRECLPFDDDCVLIDWLLATRAAASGARVAFDPEPQMRYRQYGLNVASVRPPFLPATVLAAAKRVLGHYRQVLDARRPLPSAWSQALSEAHQRATVFYRVMSDRPEALACYAQALNALPPRGVWWWCVANPLLEDLWTA